MNQLNQTFTFMADAFLPAPRPASRRSMSMDRSEGDAAARNRKRNSMIVESVLRRKSSSLTTRDGASVAASCAAPRRGGFGFGHGAQVHRWDGNKRTKSDWDSLRRDPELWFPGANALVHLYSKGQSRRGPSFRVSLRDIEESDCGPLLADALPDEPETLPLPDSSSDDDSFTANPRRDGKWELYVPAPAVLDRQGSFRYHLTTRNFFAWMFDQPLVGPKLGEALIALHERMNLWRSDREQNQDDMMAYIDSQGYTDFRDCPDHALGILQYAEQFELAELWTDAFVHCAGMNDKLVTSGDFHGVSRTSKALISRANLEMTVRLERSSMSLANFMEDDLGHLNLQEPVVRHIERFRSFIYSFYVQRHGYWPPASTKVERGRRGESNAMAKHTLLSMYSDFRSLYELLADTESTPGRGSPGHAASDGLDVAKAIADFDRKQKYSSLPYALPHLPENLPEVSESKLSSFLPSFLRRSSVELRTSTLAALHHATNVSSDILMINSPLVTEYFRFEREYTLGEDERISAVEARKARWLLVYTILQTLVDVTKAPPEVRDTDGVEYPLSCQTAGTPPWSPASAQTARFNVNGDKRRPRALQRQTSRDSFVSVASQHSAAPSARVDPLDLELVASRRLSYVQGDVPALQNRRTRAAGQTVLSPKPRRPSVQEQAFIATYDSEELAEDESDVPQLSPSLVRTDSDGRRSSDEASSASEADTPTSTSFQQAIFGGGRAGVPAPPSPSIYDEDVDSPCKSEFNLLLGRTAPKVDSDELARRWQGEIGSM